MITRSLLNILSIYVEDLVSWLQLVHTWSTLSYKPATVHNPSRWWRYESLHNTGFYFFDHLTVIQLVKIFITCNFGSLNFIIIITKPTLKPMVNLINQFMHSQLITLESILTLLFHLQQGLRSEDNCLLGYCAMQCGRCFPTFHCPHDGARKHLWNISYLLQDYMAHHPRRESSSYLSLWEYEISSHKWFPPFRIPHILTPLTLTALQRGHKLLTSSPCNSIQSLILIQF
jgi:hypothetical protein